MTEAERNSFFAHSTQRAPGKRQIKPTATMMTVVLPADEDEDDEDFRAGSGSDSEADSSNGSSEGSDEEEAEGEEADDDADYLSMLKREEDGEDEEEHVPICSLCMNLRPATRDDEVVQCDKCGVAVHERCYLTDCEVPEEASISSAGSTEPWFCEPCIFGEQEPPHCEMCPGRYGAFKRSDIGGRWVHLVCALFTPGITFGDVERLTAVSWQEMDYKLFGKKACNGCSDRLESRTGVVIGCDAALCRHFYHVTCAQRLGFLVDRTEQLEMMPETHDDDVTYHDERFVHCKKHSHEEEVRRKRDAYALFVRQEERRFATMLKRHHLNAREDARRKKLQERSRATYKALEGVTIAWPDASWDKPDKKQRRGRHLHTSSKYVEAFAEKAEMAGVSHDDFSKAFIRIDGASLPFLPPAFSPEFFAYFHNREKTLLSSEESRLERVQKENGRLKERQAKIEHNLKQLHSSHSSSSSRASSAISRLSSLHAALTALGCKKLPKLDQVMKKEPMMRNRKHSRSSISGVNGVRLSSTQSHTTPSSSTKTGIHTCDTCDKQTEQHLLVECDSCHKYYHLACLDPPLERMPRKVNCEWQCSDCVPDSDDDEVEEGSPEIGVSDSEDNGGTTRRKLRQRSDSERVRKMIAKKDEERAYKSAIARGAMPKRGLAAAAVAAAAVTTVERRRSSNASTAAPPAAKPLSPPPSRISSPINISIPASKRGRGRPKKDESSTMSSPGGERTLRSPTGSGTLSPPPAKKTKGGRPQSGSPMRRNGRILHDTADNGDDNDEEPFVIFKE